MPDADPLRTIDEFAEQIRSTKTHAYWLNATGQAPRRVRIGNRVLYRQSAIDAWIAAREVPAAATAP